MCVCVLKMSFQMTSSTPRKAAKRGESRIEAVLPMFVNYLLVLLLYTWAILARPLICGEYNYSEGVRGCGVALVNKRDTIV